MRGKSLYVWLLLAACCLLSSLSGCTGGIGSKDNDEDLLVLKVGIAYVQRTVPLSNDGSLMSDDLYRPYAFNPGARLYLKENSTLSAKPYVISDIAENGGAQGLYDVKDLSVSSDGRKLLFAMRAPDIENARPEDQPTWNIWLYDLDAEPKLRRLISSNIRAEAGQDYAPEFLPGENGEPDARIVFVSTRQTGSRAVLTDEGRGQYSGLTAGVQVEAAVLHTMEIDGSNIKQISFHDGHDYSPLVLKSGKILYSRKDSSNLGINFYQINADGTGFEYLYGRHSHVSSTGPGSLQPVYFSKAQQLNDGRLLGVKRQRITDRYGGDLRALDFVNFTEITTPVPGSPAGNAEVSLMQGVFNDGTISLGGNYAAFAALNDGSGRYLLSWDQCSLLLKGSSVPCTSSNIQAESAQQARPAYGLWLFDPQAKTRLPVVLAQSDTVISDVVVMRDNKEGAPVLSTGEVSSSLQTQQLGLVDIRSVYDIGGVDTASPSIAAVSDPLQTPVAQRPKYFLRVVKPLLTPGRNIVANIADKLGRGNGVQPGFLEIIGYVPVEPDGSAKFAVPAGMPFSFDLVDGQSRRMGERKHHWLQVAAGDTLKCQGCHSRNNRLAHGRLSAAPASINPGLAITGGNFPNTLGSLFGDEGETMAQVRHIRQGLQKPSINMLYRDHWTDSAKAAVTPEFSYRYRWLDDPMAKKASDYTLPSGVAANNIPVSEACEREWNVNCRITINYVDDIQPIWTRARSVERSGVTTDVTCTNSNCHNSVNSMGSVRLAAGQLDLTALGTTVLPLSIEGFVNSQSVACVLSGRMASYCELLNADYALLVDADGNLTPALRDPDNPGAYITASDFMSTLQNLRDADPPDPQAVLDFLSSLPELLDDLTPVLNGNGALASQSFFRRFEQFNPPQDTFDHRGILNPAEKRLLYEWLDLGAQYYNDPF